MLATPGINDVLSIVITVCGLMCGDFSAGSYLKRSIEGVRVREVAVSVGVGSVATVVVVCDVKVYD